MHSVHSAVGVVGEPVDADGSPVRAAAGQHAIVVEEVPGTVELDDSRPVGGAVARHLVHDSFERPVAVEEAASGIGDTLWVLVAVGEVEPAVTFMDVCPLLELGKLDLADRAGERGHRLVQQCGSTVPCPRTGMPARRGR